MALLAGQCDLQPPQALSVGDNANVLAFGFEDGTLLDMQLEQRMDLACADLLIALPVNTLQFITEFLALGVFAIVGPILFMDAGKDSGGEHGRCKARSFFIGPVDHDDGMFGLDVEIIAVYGPAPARPEHRERHRICRRSAACRDGCPHKPVTHQDPFPDV